MISGKYVLNLCLGKPIEGFRRPVLKPGFERPGEPPIGGREDAKLNIVQHTVEFFQEDGITKAVYTTPRGKQKVDKVTCTDYSASWECYAGSEGIELFHCVMLISESSDHVAGFTAGTAPCFRGYTPFDGIKVD
jgi:hypothetical protein